MKLPFQRKVIHEEICKVLEKRTLKQASDFLRRRGWCGDKEMSITDMVKFIKKEWKKLSKCRKLSYEELLIQRNRAMIVAKDLAYSIRNNMIPSEDYIEQALKYELRQCNDKSNSVKHETPRVI